MIQWRGGTCVLFLMAPQDVGFSAVLQSISSVRSYLRQSTELLPSRFLQLPFPAGFVPVNTEQSLTAGKILLLGAAPYYVYMGQSKCHKTTKGIHISCAHPSPRGRASPWCCNPISRPQRGRRAVWVGWGPTGGGGHQLRRGRG